MMPAAPLVVVMLFAPTILIMIFVMMAAATALFLVIVMMAPATAFLVVVMVVMTSATAFFIMVMVVMASAAALIIVIVMMAPALAVMMMVSAAAARLLFFGLGKRLGNKRSHNGLGFQADTCEHCPELLIFNHGKAVLGFGIPHAARGKRVSRFLKHPGVACHTHQAVGSRLNHIKPAFFID